MKKLLPIVAVIFIAQIFTHKAYAQMCFAPDAPFSTGWSVNYSLANADFNGDNIPDIVIANSGSDNIAITLGNGIGGFVVDTTITVGTDPRSVISADFNGDGNIDLAIVNENSDNVSIILGNGAGGFGVVTNIAVGTRPYFVISADINGDSKADLAIANYGSNNVSILLGDGLGNFGTATNFAVGTSPVSITSGDFNTDGKIDLVTANFYSNNFSLLLGDGFGNFTTSTNFSIGTWPQSVICADFNGDGKADLALSNSQSSDNISLFFGNGDATFGSVTNLTVGSGYSSLLGADFNGDGKIDLVTVNNQDSNVSVLLGNGVGGFGTIASFTVGNYPSLATSADFNGDGKLDLAICISMTNYNNVSVLLNSLPSVIANATSTTVCPGISVTLSGSGATSYTWSGGITDGTAFVPTSTTTYTVTGTTAGCNNSATKTITVLPQPTATLTTQNESSSLFCDGYIKAYLTGGTGIIQDQWLDSIQTVLSSTDSIGGLCQGIYTLHLTDANNCTNIYLDTIHAGPIPPSPPICLVTVDSTYTHNVVVWEKTNLNLAVIDSFIVYREITSNNFQAIGIVLKDSISTFTDLNANPATTGFRYKLKSKNTHGVSSAFNNYHNTIYLTNTGGNFSWTPYQVENNLTPISAYNVYRDDNSTGNFVLIGNTTGNQFGYTDIQFSSFQNSSYYVEAVLAGGSCNPTRTSFDGSRSNVKHIGTAGVQQLNKLETINIFPNPANNELTMTGITEKTILHMYDVVGKLVMEQEVENNTTINTSAITEGIYTLLTETKRSRTFNKIVISH